jgi:hypothetical protein
MEASMDLDPSVRFDFFFLCYEKERKERERSLRGKNHCDRKRREEM